MQYNIYFDICALCILVTIVITSLSRRAVPSFRQKAYGALFFSIFMATLLERIETYLQMFPQPYSWYGLAEKTAGSIFFFYHLGSAAFYLVYIMAVLDIYLPFGTSKGFVTIWLGYFIGVVLLVVNWFNPVLFYYAADGKYHRGPFLYTFYILAAYYLFAGGFLLVKYNNLMRTRTKIIIIAYVLIVFVGIVVQYFYPMLLVENFCNTISVTFIYITLQNPSEMVDDALNILNRKAFLEGIDLKTKQSSPSYTVFVTIDNVRTLSTEIGYSRGEDVLKKIAKYLKRVGRRKLGVVTYVYRYSEYVFAVTVHANDEEKVNKFIHIVSDRMKEPWSFGNMEIKVDGHLFLMSYPKNYISTGDLLAKAEMLINMIGDFHDSIIDVDAIDFATIRKESDFDNLARMNLDSKKAVIKFQPFLSKVYKINYCADVVCFLHNEAGEEIDMRGHIPDLKVTQALMDTDEFVFRRTCRALAFWNAGDKNGKYRAVIAVSQGEISKNDFVKRIKRILREEKALGSWVSIKLTETTISTMNTVAERNIKMLRDIKCSIVVDKFGSGYGDLNRILTLPVSQVNIDISILRAAMESENMKKVAHGIVNLFHDISIFVCAADIECSEDQEMAEELGCDYLIGDYMGIPMPDSSYVKFIDAYFEEG